jgi:hypothetical protein
MKQETLLGSIEKIESLADVLSNCEKQGFTERFIVLKNALYAATINKRYTPDELFIMDIYRYEGLSDPSDNGIVYALTTTDGLRGTFIDAYGVYANDLVSRFRK